MSAKGPKPTTQTRRRELEQLLRAESLAFEILRRRLGVRVQDLDEDLRHLAQSAPHRGEVLEVTPPACRDCGFVFEDRANRAENAKFSRPGRCPKCRSRRVGQSVLRLV